MSSQPKKQYESKAYVGKKIEPAQNNPWAHELAHTMKLRNQTVAVASRKASLINETTGELEDAHALVGIRKPVDRGEFVKIFEDGISSMFKLNKRAQDLFGAVLTVYLDQKMQGEWVYIAPKILEQVDYKRSTQTYRQALNELINRKFICEVKDLPNQFWVNPNFFFKGDRLTIVQDYAVIGSPSCDAMQKDIEDSKQKKLPL